MPEYKISEKQRAYMQAIIDKPGQHNNRMANTAFSLRIRNLCKMTFPHPRRKGDNTYWDKPTEKGKKVMATGGVIRR